MYPPWCHFNQTQEVVKLNHGPGMWVYILSLPSTCITPSPEHASSAVQCTTGGKCFPSPETHQLEPWSMTSEFLTARAGAAHNCCTRSLTTCLHFQGCLCGLIYALCTKPSATKSDPVFLHGGQLQRLPQVLRGRVHFHCIYLHQFFSFIIGSLVPISVPFQALCIPSLYSLEPNENIFNPLCQLFQSSALAFYKTQVKWGWTTHFLQRWDKAYCLTYFCPL